MQHKSAANKCHTVSCDQKKYYCCVVIWVTRNYGALNFKRCEKHTHMTGNLWHMTMFGFLSVGTLPLVFLLTAADDAGFIPKTFTFSMHMRHCITLKCITNRTYLIKMLISLGFFISSFFFINFTLFIVQMLLILLWIAHLHIANCWMKTKYMLHAKFLVKWVMIRKVRSWSSWGKIVRFSVHNNNMDMVV